MAGALQSNLIFISFTIISITLIGNPVKAQVHHVVGDDHGWDRNSDIQAWSSGKIYRAGDILWFIFSAALEDVVELRSKEEFDSCNISNPVKMLTDGLNRVALDELGTRFFTSSRPESCKGGLKLTVDVFPHPHKENPWNIITSEVAQKEAAAPIPSPAKKYRVSFLSLSLGFALICFIMSL